jgi:hypothetical protein
VPKAKHLERARDALRVQDFATARDALIAARASQVQVVELRRDEHGRFERV